MSSVDVLKDGVAEAPIEGNGYAEHKLSSLHPLKISKIDRPVIIRVGDAEYYVAMRFPEEGDCSLIEPDGVIRPIEDREPVRVGMESVNDPAQFQVYWRTDGLLINNPNKFEGVTVLVAGETEAAWA